MSHIDHDFVAYNALIYFWYESYTTMWTIKFYSYMVCFILFIIFISVANKNWRNLFGYRFILGIIFLYMGINVKDLWFSMVYSFQIINFYGFHICSHTFYFNTIIAACQFLIGIIFLCILFVMWFNVTDDSNINFGIPILMLVCVFASLMLVSVNDFFTLYLLIELQSFALYVLVGVNRFSFTGSSTSLKYFVYGSFASCILAFGISLIYGFTGTLDFVQLYYIITNLDTSSEFYYDILIGFLLVLVGLMFKLGIAPFHVWLPDIYEGAPFIVTFFLSIIPKIPALFILFRVFCFAYDYYHVVVNFSTPFLFISTCCAVLSIVLVV